uniref:Uncharacterized protein n=1 Tax=Anguilla anguilla TaxID=7936 RepID=A0A0E9PVR6_ANGAN
MGPYYYILIVKPICQLESSLHQTFSVSLGYTVVVY